MGIVSDRRRGGQRTHTTHQKNKEKQHIIRELQSYENKIVSAVAEQIYVTKGVVFLRIHFVNELQAIG